MVKIRLLISIQCIQCVSKEFAEIPQKLSGCFHSLIGSVSRKVWCALCSRPLADSFLLSGLRQRCELVKDALFTFGNRNAVWRRLKLLGVCAGKQRRGHVKIRHLLGLRRQQPFLPASIRAMGSDKR